MLEVSTQLRLSFLGSSWTEVSDDVPLMVAVTGEPDQKEEEEEEGRERSSTYWQ